MDPLTIGMWVFGVVASTMTAYWSARAGVVAGMAKLEQRVDSHDKKFEENDKRLDKKFEDTERRFERLEAPYFETKKVVTE